MRSEKFKIIEFIRVLILAVDKEMINFPKSEMELKSRIRKNSYDALELAYEANATENEKLKIQLFLKTLAKIKVVDFLLNLSYDKKIITEKKYIKFGNRMDDIVKYITGYINKLKGIKKENSVILEKIS